MGDLFQDLEQVLTITDSIYYACSYPYIPEIIFNPQVRSTKRIIINKVRMKYNSYKGYCKKKII